MYRYCPDKISLEKAVSDGDIPAVTKLLDTENITQDRITYLKKSIEEKKKDWNQIRHLQIDLSK